MSEELVAFDKPVDRISRVLRALRGQRAALWYDQLGYTSRQRERGVLTSSNGVWVVGTRGFDPKEVSQIIVHYELLSISLHPPGTEDTRYRRWRDRVSG